MKITNRKQPDLELNFKSSVANLDPIINVNGLDGTTILRYNGKFADSSILRPWGYGETLGIADSGDAPTLNDGSPLLGAYDDSVKFNGGEVYQASGSAFADVTTEDLYIEGWFKTPADLSGIQTILAKYGSPAIGWMVYTSGTSIRFYTDGAGGNICFVKYDAALNPNTWYYISAYRDSSETSLINGFQIYVNALNNSDYSSAYAPSDVGSISSSNLLTIGGYSSFLLKGNYTIAYLLMSKRSNWFAGGAQNLIDWAALHEERFARLTATYPVIGTSLPEHTRNSPAFLRKTDDDGYATYHLMGAGWPRTSKLIDANGVEFIGAENEESADNECLQSQSKGTTWAKITAGDTVSEDQSVAPNGTATMDAIIADATDAIHGYTQDVTLTAASWVYSEHFKQGVKSWGYLANTTVSNCYAYFDLDNGAVGSKGAGVSDHGMSQCANGSYRCWITLTGTAAAHTFQCAAAHADNDNDFSGDGSAKSVYFWGSQIELGNYPSSYISTTTATVTRAADVLEYEYSNDLAQGSKVFDFVKPATPLVDTNIFTISDGTDDNKIYAYVDSDGFLNAEIIYGGSSEGTVQIATDICDNEKKKIAARWKDTLEILVYDYHTQEIETDSTAISNVPTNLTTNEFESGNFIIGSSKDYEYYESSNSRLLGVREAPVIDYVASKLVPSVANLNPIINVNGLDGTTILRYNGKFADSSILRPWGYGETLGIASSGTSPTLNDGSPLLGAYDDSVKFNGGEVYQADNNSFADVTTEDLYDEILFTTPDALSGTKMLKSKGNNYIYLQNALLVTQFSGAGGSRYGIYSSLTPNTTYFISSFWDPSEATDAHGLQIYLNKLNSTIYGGTAANPTAVGTLSNVSSFALGSDKSLGSKYDGAIAYLLMAKRSNWFAGGAQNLIDWAALHEERFSRLKNLHSFVGNGTLPRSF